MRAHRLIRLLVVFLFVATVTLATSPDSRRKLVERSIQPEVMAEDSRGDRLSDRMRALAAPGLAVAVIDDFEIDWSHSYGLADPDGRKLTPELRHNVGSVSKTVCALTALRLVEMGKLSLDAPINDSLKSWKLPDNELTEQTPVTLRHLLSHSGGTTVHGFPGYGPDDTLPTIRQLLDGEPPSKTGAIRVDRRPGEGYRYSGGGTTIVQLAIVDVTGRPFEEVARELVFEPLGMKHSTYVQPLDGVDIGPRALGHANSPTFSGTVVFTAVGAAGLWSTAEDLARMLIGVMKSARGDEGALLKQETVQEMLTPVAGSAGLGFFIGDHDGARSFGHGGDNIGFHAQVWGLDATGQGAVTLVNSDAGRPLQMEFLRAAADVYDWPEGAWEPRRVDVGRVDRKTAKSLAGRYRLGPNDVITIARTGNRLTYRECYWRDRVTDMLPLANGNFLLISGSNAFGHHAEFGFERDERGAVTAMRLAGSQYVMPRLIATDISPLEHIEAGRLEPALRHWDEAPDLDAGLMRFTARQIVGLDSGDVPSALRLRTFNADRFPLADWAQEMLAEGLEHAGRNTEAGEVRERHAARSKRLEAISGQFEAGQIDEGLATFDRLAGEVGSRDAYRWLLETSRSTEDSDVALKSARHAHRKLPGSADAQEVLAYALQATGDLPAAIEAMDNAIATRPEVDETVMGRMWMRDRWKGESVQLTPEQQARYVGDYGARHIVIHDGRLAYYRDSNEPRPLIPVGEHQFMMRGTDSFRLEFVLDDRGVATKIVGHYREGRRDESPRDGSQPN